MRQAGWVVVAIVGAVVAWNAAFMAISPTAWFRLPGWMRANGALSRDKYSHGWGAIQLRLAGVAMLGVISWVLYDALLKR